MGDETFLPDIPKLSAGGWNLGRFKLGIFFLMRASEAPQIRQKDVEIIIEDGEKRLVIFIYISKEGQTSPKSQMFQHRWRKQMEKYVRPDQ